MTKTYELDSNDRAILELACDLYNEVGHDLGPNDAFMGDEEVASVLQDRMGDYISEHGTAFASAWDGMPASKKFAICLMAI